MRTDEDIQDWLTGADNESVTRIMQSFGADILRDILISISVGSEPDDYLERLITERAGEYMPEEETPGSYNVTAELVADDHRERMRAIK